MDQFLREYLAQQREYLAQIRAETAQMEAEISQRKAKRESELARLDSKSATHVTEQPTTAAAAAPQDEKPRLCDVQTITIETDNASETDNTLVQAYKTDDASETNGNALVQANEASEFNTITLIQADIASENRHPGQAML